MKALSFYYGLNVKTIGEKLSNFLKLYHESLQQLVQGYREVTLDSKGEFKFEKDGRTVKDKLDEYENKLHEYSTGMKKQLKKEENK